MWVKFRQTLLQAASGRRSFSQYHQTDVDRSGGTFAAGAPRETYAGLPRSRTFLQTRFPDDSIHSRKTGLQIK